MMGAMRTRTLQVVVALVVALAATSCGGDPDPEESAADLSAMRTAVNSELRDMAAALTGAGLTVERGVGRVESEGMSTYRAEDYKATAVVVGSGDEGEQVETAATALEDAGWTRTADDLAASEPWAQLERDDFRTTIAWSKVGDRELVLSLDQAGEVQVAKDADPVDRDNAEDIPLD